MTNSNIETKLSRFANRSVTKTTTFLGEDVVIRKLTLGQMLKVQDMNEAMSAKGVEMTQFDYLRLVCNIIQMGCAELEADCNGKPEFLHSMPLDDLRQLGEEIMEFSGARGNAQAVAAEDRSAR